MPDVSVLLWQQPQTIPGCVYTAAVAGGDSWDDSKRCDIAPVAIKVPKGTGATSYSTARTPIVRCQVWHCLSAILDLLACLYDAF